MSKEIPSFEKGVEKARETVQEGRRLIPWLPDPHRCECGALCYAEHDYVESQAMVMPIWECRECGKRYYRDESV